MVVCDAHSTKEAPDEAVVLQHLALAGGRRLTSLTGVGRGAETDRKSVV